MMTITDITEVIIDIGQLRPALVRAARLFLETVLVPTVLLYALLHTVGLTAGLIAVLAWGALTVGLRWITGRHLPGTLLLSVALLCGRAAVALILSSALVYLVQPVVGSLLMAVLFLGSAVIGRPITVRLARDFVALPAHLFHRRAVRRMFTQVAVMWGGSRLVDATMTLVALRFGVDAGLLSRGMLSSVLTGVTVLACTGWGWRCLRRQPGITFRLHSRRSRTAGPVRCITDEYLAEVLEVGGDQRHPPA